MRDIKAAYKFSKDIYDDTLTQSKWWSKLYISIFWGGVDDTKIAKRILDIIPIDFNGKILDVPVGTAVFTCQKYKTLNGADITCLDYSVDMLSSAKKRFENLGLSNITCIQGDVGDLEFQDNTFDLLLSMNGFHAFPDKRKAFFETARVLKSGGIFCGCFYIKGENKKSDFIVNSFLAKKGWFAPPFQTLEELAGILHGLYSKVELFNDQAIAYFKCIK
ncbi:MAG TPA: class I SAM-dependent methyltransferase [Negativicutes bacterium]|nr:class I SAM-dependent methyltransferase [Negativicutes bacterium]